MEGHHAGTLQKINRLAYMDFLRVLATIFVIACHTTALAIELVEPQSVSFVVLELFNNLFFTNNLLFLMLSGALLLGVRDEKMGAFFSKRFLKIAVPMAVYYILYVVAKEGIVWITPPYWKALFLRILMGVPEEAPHFWLIYTLFFLYALTPFFRFFVQNISDEVFAGVIAVIFVMNALDTFLPIWDLTFPFSSIVDSCAGVFLLGYFVVRVQSRRVENFFLVAGVCSFLLSDLLTCTTESYRSYLYQNSPLMMFSATALFLCIRRISQKYPSGSNRLAECYPMRILRKYSFSILLVHWGVLHVFVKQLLGIDVLSGGIWGGCLLMIGLTLLFSLCFSIVIDKTLVRLVYEALKLLGKGFDVIKRGLIS